MKKVQIYDQYGELKDSNDSLLLPTSGISYNIASNLTDIEANNLVVNLYNDAKLLGSYEDKNINLDNGYAELNITLENNRKLCRVIYKTDE